MAKLTTSLSLVPGDGGGKRARCAPLPANAPENLGPHIRSVLALNAFYASRPSLDDVARFITALMCWPVDALATLIIEEHDDGPRVSGRSVDQLRYGGGLADGAPLPSTLTMLLDECRESGPVVSLNPLDAHTPNAACWPLGPTVMPEGFLVVFIGSPAQPDLIEAIGGRLAESVTVYLAGLTRGSHASSAPAHPDDQQTRATTPACLSPRQLEILAFMSSGMTNPQIASRIGFSESTVRMETLLIYRFLEVHDRQHAVQAARGKGLLTPSPMV